MEENKRIILVGPACAGKTYIRDKFRKRGFDVGVSWTTRPKREGEVQDVDYYFTTIEYFEALINCDGFYEWAKVDDYYYGTLAEDWKELSQVFIMETDGISKIRPEDRASCLIIYINTPFDTRLKRMRERGWSDEKISARIKIDQQKFRDFTDYDLEINSEIHI